MERVAIFVDVQNIYHTTRHRYQKHFNYSAFWLQATQDKHVVTANAYATDRGDHKQLGFQYILKTIGFTVKLKPYIQRRDGSTKGDWDVGITLDVMDYAPQVDKVILLSGDGDFDVLLQKVQRDFAVTTEVYGVESLTAPALIRSATHFIPIESGLLL